jgi:uncharacterized delta-60 repeat protein
MSAAVGSHPRRSAFGAALAVVVLLAWPAASHGAPGDLDPSFGTGGIARPGDAVSAANAMVLQADGRIVLAGSTAGTGFDWRLTRLNPDGLPDAGFGTGGVVTTDFGGDYDIANAVALQPDGRIVVAGTEGASSGIDRDFAVARYNPDGSLDTGFGAGGRVTVSLAAGPDDPFGVVVQPDGRIVVAGIAAGDFGVLRLNADGTFDASFGSGGSVRTDVAPQDYVRAVVVQPDGRIVVGGGSGSGASGTFSLVRHLTDGSLDPTFGPGGVVRTDVAPGLEFIYAMARQPDGRIVVTGPVTALDFAVARYEPDGDLDPTFGFGGIVLTDFAGGFDIPSAIAVQPDGRIVVAGSAGGASGGAEDFALARYLPGGTLDPSFGTGGKVTTNTSGGSDVANALALQRDGRILAAGSRFDVVRYLGNGASAPTVALAGGTCSGHNDASARLVLRVGDADTPAGALRVSVASSNPSVVPASGLRLGGAGERHTLDIAAARSGTATVTITVTDAAQPATLAVRVMVGTPAADTLGGTAGIDVLFSLAGKDDLRGAAGDDLLCAGNGSDRLDGGDGADGLFGQNGPDGLTGGAGPDLFSGGHGLDAFADLNPAQEDRTDGT